MTTSKLSSWKLKCSASITWKSQLTCSSLARIREFAIMSGVRSVPVTWCPCFARRMVKKPVPQPTSKILSLPLSVSFSLISMTASFLSLLSFSITGSVFFPLFKYFLSVSFWAFSSELNAFWGRYFSISSSHLPANGLCNSALLCSRKLSLRFVQ